MPTAGSRHRSPSAPPRLSRHSASRFWRSRACRRMPRRWCAIARKSPVPIAVGERHYTRWAFSELLASRTIGGAAAGHHPERRHRRGAADRGAGGDALRLGGAAQPLELGQHRSLAPPRRGAAQFPDAGGDHRARALEGRRRHQPAARWMRRGTSRCRPRQGWGSRSTSRRRSGSRRS